MEKNGCCRHLPVNGNIINGNINWASDARKMHQFFSKFFP
jgi:hypothetical protein